MKKPCLAVIGQGSNLSPKAEAGAVGLARALRFFEGDIHTGACGGVSSIVVNELHRLRAPSRIIGFSPGTDVQSHIGDYGYPTEGYHEMRFCGNGKQGRSFDLMREADGVLMVAGKMGTLLEFVLAYRAGKTVGILPIESTASEHEFVEALMRNCNEPGCGQVIIDPRPEWLVPELLGFLSASGSCFALDVTSRTS